MKEINVTGQKRTDLGKKASKTLRKEGLVPCNLYGLAEAGRQRARRPSHSLVPYHRVPQDYLHSARLRYQPYHRRREHTQLS